MEINVNIWYWILGIIILIIYIKKRKKIQEDLEIFLDMIYAGVLENKKKLEKYGEKQSRQSIARDIKKKLEEDFEQEFKTLLPVLRFFSLKSFKFFSEDPETNAFIGKIFPTIKVLYKNYTYTKSCSRRASLELFNKIEEIILLDLEKDSTLPILPLKEI